MGKDAAVLKEAIVSLLRINGPTLPVAISKNIGSNSLFTSAFLSELVEDKRIRMSFMRVGSSPIYFLEGQEAQLDRFASNLKSKEREAFQMLKEKKFLIDSEQSPPIRVAIREIKDFAIPFQHETGLVWKYISADESEFTPRGKPKQEQVKIIEVKQPETIEVQVTEVKEKKESEQEIKKTKIQKKKKKVSIKGKSKNYDFFNKVKDYLTSKGIEIVEVKQISSNELVLLVKEQIEEVLIAFNKRKLSDSDIIKASKVAAEYKMPFRIYSSGETLKKTKSMIDAIRNLSSIEMLK